MIINNTDLAWAAGFFDGEGCVLIRNQKTRTQKLHTCLRIAVVQVNPTPINKFKEFFGGHISYEKAKREGWHAGWRWEQDAKLAGNTLQQLLPYLKVKKDVVELALEFQSKKKHGRKLTEANLQEEQQYKEKISFLNRKD